jgi:hypothetical protein
LEYSADYITPESLIIRDDFRILSVFDNIPETSDANFIPGQIYGWNQNTKTFNSLGGIN